MRRAAKVDANQPEIVEAARACGAEVQHLHHVGGGCPDILIGARGLMLVGDIDPVLLERIHQAIMGSGLVIYDGANILVEIKDGAKPPSKQKLTEDEEEWHQRWKGQVCIWRSVKETIAGLARKR